MRLLIATAAVVFVAAAAHDERGGTLRATSEFATAGDDQRRPAIRFAAMDVNGDGVITRQEWRGSARSFEVHDWNGDGRLSGDEVRIGANVPNRPGTPPEEFNDWSQQRFRWLDTNRDNRVSRAEWRYDLEDFFRADRNGDNVLTLREFLIGDEDDDRGDRFADLDIDNDNQLSRAEWHGSLATFNWLDRNRDGVLSRQEVVGTGALEEGRPGTRVAPRTVVVSAREPWTDTRLDVGLNDLITVSATGSILYSAARSDVAQPSGGAGNATPAAPRPDVLIGALLGRIGINGEVFVIGRGVDSYRATRAGRLYLGVNDDVLTDNSGQFRAVVSLIRR